MSKPEIRPCPFCGADEPINLTVTEHSIYPLEGQKAWVECEACGTEGPVGEHEQDAIERWNERAK